MLGGLCIALMTSATTVVLPTDRITLSWNHTVERVPWEEDYAIKNAALVILEARVKRSGAGMEPPSGSIWREGWWHYTPSLGRLPEVILANSAFADGYSICWNFKCRAMNDLVPANGFVKLAPAQCSAPTHEIGLK